MAAISGKNGNVQAPNGTDVAEVTSWSFEQSSNNPAWASSDSAGYKKRVAGVKDGSGSIEGKYDPADQVHARLTEGMEVILKLYINASRFYLVPAIIDSLNFEVDMDEGEVVSWTADFSTNGSWTQPVAS